MALNKVRGEILIDPTRKMVQKAKNYKEINKYRIKTRITLNKQIDYGCHTID